MPLSIPRRVPLSRRPLSGQFRQPSPRKRSTSPAALAIDSDRSCVNRTVSSNNGVVRSMRASTHAVPWPASLSTRPRDLGTMIHEDEPSTRPREMSWSSTIEESEPIDIPSTGDGYSPRDYHSNFAREVDNEVGDGTGQGTDALDSCWSAAWYSSEPWNRTTEYPEKAPAHIMIWEKRALKSASVAAEETRRRRSGGVLEGAPSNEGTSSEDNSIFELDM